LAGKAISGGAAGGAISSCVAGGVISSDVAGGAISGGVAGGAMSAGVTGACPASGATGEGEGISGGQGHLRRRAAAAAPDAGWAGSELRVGRWAGCAAEAEGAAAPRGMRCSAGDLRLGQRRGKYAS